MASLKSLYCVLSVTMCKLCACGLTGGIEAWTFYPRVVELGSSVLLPMREISRMLLDDRYLLGGGDAYEILQWLFGQNIEAKYTYML
jgi:hypothetical protein